MLKRNLIANYIGQAWTALMGLAFVPLYIKYLGMEAYGLIGLFALLNAWLSLFEMGMMPTLNREMARFTSGNRSPQSIRDLLRTIEFIAIVIAFIIAVIVTASSHWLASNWLKSEKLPIEVVSQAFMVMGFVTSLRFIEGVYQSTITGLQKQVLLNILLAASATLRGVGAVIILAYVSPTIQAFFIWQGLISILALVLLVSITYSSMPSTGRRSHFSIIEMRGVWKFSIGVLSITFLALLLTQIDKILLSKLLTLHDFGYYTLAATVSGSLFMLIRPITQAYYPRMCELYASNDLNQLNLVYHHAAQLVSVIAGSFAIVIIFNSEPLLLLWTQDPDLVSRTAPILKILMLGNLINGLMWIPYQAQLAHGWTSLTIRTNILFVLVIVPSIIWFTPRYGVIGAAWVWVSLNVGYLFFSAKYIFRYILLKQRWPWYMQDILAPLFAGTCAALIMKIIFPIPVTFLSLIFQIGFSAFLILLSSISAAAHLRKYLLCKVYPKLFTKRIRL
jgi:O-antigen/teichoic acid export membrane protein